MQKQLPSQRYPLRMLQAINKYLYDDLGFKGNKTEYYSPRNSFLNDVIEQRTGIPVTLSLVYLEIARRIGFKMVGIGMPGHFLIRPEFEEAGIFVDAFNRGEILFEQDCRERLAQVYQQPIRDIPPEFLAPIIDILPALKRRGFQRSLFRLTASPSRLARFCFRYFAEVVLSTVVNFRVPHGICC